MRALRICRILRARGGERVVLRRERNSACRTVTVVQTHDDAVSRVRQRGKIARTVRGDDGKNNPRAFTRVGEKLFRALIVHSENVLGKLGEIHDFVIRLIRGSLVSYAD